MCIVWTPLPLITGLLPNIGHTGICDSKGICFDFAGPYTIGRDHLAFGKTHKYLKLDLEGVSEKDYDEAIKEANNIYRGRMHNICCDNCHSHVARALNILKYKGYESYTMVHVWAMCFCSGKWVSCCHFLWTYLCWILIAIGLFCYYFIPWVTNPNPQKK